MFQVRTDAGLNRRGVDIVKAFHDACSSIIDEDPPLVIHSGDLFESPSVPVRYLLAARRELSRLTEELRPDGTRRAVVVISGNHDTSRNVRDGCQLDLFKGIPGVFPVSFGYEVLRFDADDGFDPVLADVAVHALPHDSLRDPELVASVSPLDGYTSSAATARTVVYAAIQRRQQIRTLGPSPSPFPALFPSSMVGDGPARSGVATIGSSHLRRGGRRAR
jgi:hypothetical protein